MGRTINAIDKRVCFVLQSTSWRCTMNRSASSSKLFALAVSEWLLVLPAALLLGGAALRQFQPPRNEPARTLSALLGWVVPRISHAGAAVLFLGLPAIAAIAGCVALLMAWRKSETL